MKYPESVSVETESKSVGLGLGEGSRCFMERAGTPLGAMEMFQNSVEVAVAQLCGRAKCHEWFTLKWLVLCYWGRGELV